MNSVSDESPDPADAAWVHVPGGLGTDLDRFAHCCHDLAVAWFTTARGLGAIGHDDSSAAADARQFRRSKASAPANVEHAVGQQAGLYADAIAQHILALEALLRARRVAVAVWPIVRAELELAGRVAWMLDPQVDDRAGEVRVARLYLEAISSLQRERFTASKLDGQSEKRAKRARDAKIAEAQVVFGEFSPDLSSPEKYESWSLAGESFLGVGRSATLFIERCFDASKGLYDVLSDYAHPSLLAIGRQTAPIVVGDVVTRPWTIDSRGLEEQVRLACLILYKACRLITGYYAIDASALERWADSVPGSWFADGADP